MDYVSTLCNYNFRVYTYIDCCRTTCMECFIFMTFLYMYIHIFYCAVYIGLVSQVQTRGEFSKNSLKCERLLSLLFFAGEFFFFSFACWLSIFLFSRLSPLFSLSFSSILSLFSFFIFAFFLFFAHIFPFLRFQYFASF